jgi:AP-4 complex subunit mu-1
MLFVVSTKHNVSPSFVFDALYRCMKVFRDYLGVLSEEAIRKNFILIYEIIDEMFDFGHPQSMTTESIKDYIVNTPVMISQSSGSSFKPSILTRNVISSSAIQRTVSKTKSKNKEEIFVDIFDKLTVLFNSNGAVINSFIDGVI